MAKQEAKVAAVKSQVNRERHEVRKLTIPVVSQRALRLQKKPLGDRGYIKTKEEILLKEFRVPTVRQLLAESCYLKDQTEHLKTINVSEEAKAFGLGTLEYIRHLESGVKLRQQKLFGRN